MGTSLEEEQHESSKKKTGSYPGRTSNVKSNKHHSSKQHQQHQHHSKHQHVSSSGESGSLMESDDHHSSGHEEEPYTIHKNPLTMLLHDELNVHDPKDITKFVRYINSDEPL